MGTHTPKLRNLIKRPLPIPGPVPLPLPKSVPRVGITCNQLASDGRPKRDPVDKGPISGLSMMNQVRRPHCGRTDAVDFIAD